MIQVKILSRIAGVKVLLLYNMIKVILINKVIVVNMAVTQ